MKREPGPEQERGVGLAYVMARRKGAALAAAFVIIAAIPFLFVGLGRAPFDDPGEGMHAEIARELASARDPVALRLNGVRYVDKPPLLYVLIATAVALFGPSEAVARAVPAIGALVAVGATAWLGGYLLGAWGGVIAGLALLTSAGFFAYGRYLRPETLLVGSLSLGFTLALIGLTQGRRRLVIAGLAAFGVAGLSKDVLAAVMPVAVIGLALALGGHARPFSRWLPGWGVAACVVLVAGWWVVAEVGTPGFTWYTVVDNHLLNIMRARRFPDEDIPLSAAAFLAVATIGAAPWVIGAGATVGGLLRSRAWQRPSEMPWVALALWAVGVLGFTVLSPFRLPHYGLPAYPMIALLAARAWMTDSRDELSVLSVIHVAFFTVVGLGCLILATAESAFMTTIMGATDVATRKNAALGQASPLPPWELFRPLLAITGGAFLVGAGLVALAAFGKRGGRLLSPRLAVMAVAVTMLAVMPAVAVALTSVANHRAVRALALEIRRRAASTDVIVHEGPIENSGALEWYSGRRAVIVAGRRSVLAFGAQFPDAHRLFWDAARLEREWHGAQRIWIITTRAPGVSIVQRLPNPRLILSAGGRWLYVNREGSEEHADGKRRSGRPG